MNWKEQLIKKIEMDNGNADGLWKFAHEIADELYLIFARDNELNDIGEAYFPDGEIACHIYDMLKYGK